MGLGLRAGASLVVGIVVFAAGCMDEEPRLVKPSFDFDVVPFVPAPECDMVVVEDEGPFAHHRLKNNDQQRLVYMNRHGGTYVPSYYNDSSQNLSTVPRQTSTVPPYSGSDARWDALVDCVRAEYERWNIRVTEHDPGDEVYVEVVNGGLPGHLGLPSGVLGVAPFTCSGGQGGQGGVIERAIVFSFTDAAPSVEVECLTAIHELGHAYGLDHIFYCPDPMSYLQGCGPKAFQDRDSSCGEYSARQCTCGSSSLNAVSHLDDLLGIADLGPDITPPTVDVLMPEHDVLPGNAQVRIQAAVEDDREVAEAALLWEIDGEVIEMDCAAPPSLVECSRAWNTYTWRFPVTEGTRTFRVRGVDGAGNETISPARDLFFDAEILPEPQGVTVEMTSPPDGTEMRRGEALAFRASVLALGGSRAVRVRLLALSSEQAFEMEPDSNETVWEVRLTASSSAPLGEQQFQAEAQDEGGAWTASSIISVFVVP